MKIRRIAKFQDSIKEGEARLSRLDELGFDRTVYKSISSRTDNRSLVTPVDRDSEFHRYLLDMNKYHDTGVITPQLQVLDEYLGRLGVEESYPFMDDAYISEPWIEYSSQDPFRNVVHIDDQDEVFNVVHFDGSIMYNVIHSTQG